MKRYYDQERGRLVFVGSAATAAFWDDLWLEKNVAGRLAREERSTWHAGITKRFLPARRSTRLLDGGCGAGGIVASLRRAGYDASGIDTAVRTIAAARAVRPDLPLRVGDVTSLPFEGNFFDGYWSLGVIEHDYDGFAAIISEAWRVLRPGGFLFLTFPYLNVLRRSKAALGMYPDWQSSQTSERRRRFYQFALPWSDTAQQVQQAGFRLRMHRPLDGYKGVKDEVALLRGPLQYLYELPSRPAGLVRTGLSLAAAPVAGHVMLGVFEKE